MINTTTYTGLQYNYKFTILIFILFGVESSIFFSFAA